MILTINVIVVIIVVIIIIIIIIIIRRITIKYRDRYRTPTITNTKLLVTLQNGRKP